MLIIQISNTSKRPILNNCQDMQVVDFATWKETVFPGQNKPVLSFLLVEDSILCVFPIEDV
jgi:hypothetical protein